MARRRKTKTEEVRNLVVISDLHCGCRLGLCPPEPVVLDDGGTYKHSRLQAKVWGMWEEFWGEWVPAATKGEPYAVVVNGDAMDGVHHRSVTQVSQNLVDQLRIAELVLAPIVERAVAYYHIRGTEAHVGPSGQYEEMLARNLGAIPGDDGEHARWAMLARVGWGLVHLTHHIGTTGSMHYETTAIQKELSEMYTEAARWGTEPPDVIVRSHRHRNAETRIRVKKKGRSGFATSCVTAGWQLKTPFAHKIPGGRVAPPQIGGSVVRCGDEEMYTRHQVWDLKMASITKIGG
jgi:hypothetical protein